MALFDDPLHHDVRIGAERGGDRLVESLSCQRFRVVVDREGRDPSCAGRELPGGDDPQFRSRQTSLLRGPSECLERWLGAVDADDDEMLGLLPGSSIALIIAAQCS